MIKLESGQDSEDAITLEAISGEFATQLGRSFSALDPWARYPYSADALAKYLAADEPGAPRYAIMQGGNCLGAIGLRANWLAGPYVQFFGLLPDHQRMGIGGRVLDWVEADARCSEARNVWVAASAFNYEAVRFYESRGFLRMATLENLVRDGFSELLMRKTLTN